MHRDSKDLSELDVARLRARMVDANYGAQAYNHHLGALGQHAPLHMIHDNMLEEDAAWVINPLHFFSVCSFAPHDRSRIVSVVRLNASVQKPTHWRHRPRKHRKRLRVLRRLPRRLSHLSPTREQPL